MKHFSLFPLLSLAVSSLRSEDQLGDVFSDYFTWRLSRSPEFGTLIGNKVVLASSEIACLKVWRSTTVSWRPSRMSGLRRILWVAKVCSESRFTLPSPEYGAGPSPLKQRGWSRCRPLWSAPGPTPLSLRGPDCWLSNSQLVNEETRYYITN